jgi:hypothetical protein
MRRGGNPNFTKGHRLGFQPGVSGNPGGRRKHTMEELRAMKDVRTAAKEYTLEAIKTLVEIMRDAESGRQARIMAANSLLDRGHGKPTQTIAGDPDKPLTLMQIVEVALSKPKPLPDWIQQTQLRPEDFTPDGRLLPPEERPRRVIDGEVVQPVQAPVESASAQVETVDALSLAGPDASEDEASDAVAISPVSPLHGLGAIRREAGPGSAPYPRRVSASVQGRDAGMHRQWENYDSGMACAEFLADPEGAVDRRCLRHQGAVGREPMA